MHDYRLDFMQRGMTSALENFQRVKSSATTDFVEIELVEVLLWVAAINERIYKIGGKSYEQWRDSSPAGRIVNALRFVRNAYVHSGPEAISFVGGGVSFPLTFPIVFGTPSLVWKSLEKIGNTGKPDADGEALYRDVLQGKKVAETLQDAHDWLDSELEQYRESGA